MRNWFHNSTQLAGFSEIFIAPKMKIDPITIYRFPKWNVALFIALSTTSRHWNNYRHVKGTQAIDKSSRIARN